MKSIPKGAGMNTKTLLFYIIFAFMLIGTFFIFGCRESEIVKDTTRPNSCFDAHTLFKGSKGFVTGTKASLISMITTAFNKCWTDEENKLKRDQREKIIKTCVTIIYKEKQLSKKEDRSRYIDFLECMNKLENIK